MKLKFLYRTLIIVILFQLTICPVQTYAGFFSDIFSEGDNFIEQGKKEAENKNSAVIDEDALQESSGKMFNALLAIGVILTVIVGGVLGIKFMMASAEDKAKIKEMMIPYLLGCAVIYGAFAIWKFTIEILAKV